MERDKVTTYISNKKGRHVGPGVLLVWVSGYKKNYIRILLPSSLFLRYQSMVLSNSSQGSVTFPLLQTRSLSGLELSRLSCLTLKPREHQQQNHRHAPVYFASPTLPFNMASWDGAQVLALDQLSTFHVWMTCLPSMLTQLFLTHTFCFNRSGGHPRLHGILPPPWVTPTQHTCFSDVEMISEEGTAYSKTETNTELNKLDETKSSGN